MISSQSVCVFTFVYSVRYGVASNIRLLTIKFVHMTFSLTVFTIVIPLDCAAELLAASSFT